MVALRVIESPPAPPKPDYPGIYRRALARKIKQIPETPTKEWNIQFIYLGVKGVPIAFKDCIRSGGFEPQTFPSKEELIIVWNVMQSVDCIISRITPKDLTQIFPITKEYDGKRWETKDYFFTMDALEKHGMDTPIAESVSEILFDYENWHVRHYEVAKMMVLSDLRKYDGHPGLMEEFMVKKGVTPMQMMTDDEGRQFMYDPEKHTSFPLARPRPRYLKVVK